MERVLVYGVKDPPGGVEKISMEYIRSITAKYDLRFDLLVFGDSFSQEEAYRKMGCRVLYIPVRRKNPAGYRKRMAQIFAENQYVAVWCNFAGLTNLDPLILGKKYGVPVRIAHSHGSRLYWGSPIMKYVVTFLHHLNKTRLAEYATDYWACSDLAGIFMFPSELQDQIKIVPNAVDTDVFYPDPDMRCQKRAQLGITGDAIVIGHVARICEVKNQGFLLKIMAELIKLDPRGKLLFVGDGELHQQILEQVHSLGLDEYVIMTGNRTDVAELLQVMDVFVLTSFSEGLSVSAVEAQASGVPCVLPTTVSRSTDITGDVTFLSLEDSAFHWAVRILEACGAKASNPKERIKAAGYDLADAAESLYWKFVGAEE